MREESHKLSPEVSNTSPATNILHYDLYMQLFGYDDLSKSHTDDWFSDKIKKMPSVDMKFLSSINGHPILYSEYSYGLVEFYLSENNKITLVIQAKKKGNVYTIGAVRGENNSIPAYKIYSHLIKRHDYVLVSDKKHSYGGRSTWVKLSKQKSISIHGWDTKYNKPINLGNSLSKVLDEVYIMSNETDNKSLSGIKNIVLIAHKK